MNSPQFQAERMEIGGATLQVIIKDNYHLLDSRLSSFNYGDLLLGETRIVVAER
jgi:hypothetical protein